MLFEALALLSSNTAKESFDAVCLGTSTANINPTSILHECACGKAAKPMIVSSIFTHMTTMFYAWVNLEGGVPCRAVSGPKAKRTILRCLCSIGHIKSS